MNKYIYIYSDAKSFKLVKMKKDKSKSSLLSMKSAPDWNCLNLPSSEMIFPPGFLHEISGFGFPVAWQGRVTLFSMSIPWLVGDWTMLGGADIKKSNS